LTTKPNVLIAKENQSQDYMLLEKLWEEYMEKID